MTSSANIFFITQIALAFTVPLLLGLQTAGISRQASAWYAAGIYYAFYLILPVALPPHDLSFLKVFSCFVLWSYLAILIGVLFFELRGRFYLTPLVLLALLATAAQVWLLSSGHVLEEKVFVSAGSGAGNLTYALLAMACWKKFESRSLLLIALAGGLMVIAQCPVPSGR